MAVRDEFARLFNALVERIKMFGLEHFGRYYGTYRGVVIENRDPEDRGRIRVMVPSVAPDVVLPEWAIPKTPAAFEYGFFWPPPIHTDEKPSIAWVEFEGGDPTKPLYTGGYWGEPNGVTCIPVEVRRATPGTEAELGADGDPVTARILKTPGGHYLLMDDKEGEQVVRLLWSGEDAKKALLNIDKNGSILLQAANGSQWWLDATKNETTLFGPGDGGPSASLSMTPTGLKMIDPYGQVFEFKEGTLYAQATKRIQMIVGGALLTLDQGKVLLTGQDGSHLSVEKGKVQAAVSGGGVMTLSKDGGTIIGANGESFSLAKGKAQINAPGGGVLIQGAGGLTTPSATIGGAAATDWALKAVAFLGAFDGHIHLAPTGPTGPPVVLLSPIGQTLMAQKLKVG